MSTVMAESMSNESWNQPCLEEHLAEIVALITEWREISPFLGLTEAEEHEILRSAPHSVRSQKIAMLRLWKKKKGKAATYNRLCRAFRNSEQLDLEDKLKEILAESYSLVDCELIHLYRVTRGYSEHFWRYRVSKSSNSCNFFHRRRIEIKFYQSILLSILRLDS